jgi:hypothetical protein
MTVKTLDDDALDALLSAPDQPLAADGEAFTAAVMQRVRVEAAARTLEAPAALARLQRDAVALRRAATWRRRGMAVGSALAAGTWFAFGGAAALAAPQVLTAAVVAAAAVCLWALAAAPAGSGPRAG